MLRLGCDPKELVHHFSAHEFVANAPDPGDVHRCRGIVLDLLPQAHDMGVHGAGGHESTVPGRIDDRVAGDDLAFLPVTQKRK